MKQQVKISKVKGNPDNPRIIKNDKFKKLVKSIQEFPEMLKLRPIVVDEGMMVLGGNMRLKASKDAGLKEVWIEVAEDLTEEQKKEFIVKDNVGFGEWEWDMLANEWDSVQLAEWGLDVWENEDDKEPEAGLIEDDEIPEVKESKVKRGDIWQLGEHRIMCGDSTSSDDVEKLMNGEKADMVFTDPPYNLSFKGSMSNTTKDGVMIKHKGANQKHNEINNDKMSKDDFYNFILDMLKEIKTNCKGAFYICFGSQTLNQLLQPFLDLGMEYKSIIIWKKNQATLSGKDYKGRYEPIIYGRFNNEFYAERYKQEDIWEYQRTLKNDLHPTMKPIPLIENAIKNSSKANMKVLDLFLGSGSTLIAAEKLNRKCYGMELDEKYCDVIIERWEQFTGQKAIKNGTK